MSESRGSALHRTSCLARAIAFAAVIVPGVAIAQSVVMTGLDNPRGLAFGPDGALYVAEAGRGPSDPSCFASPQQQQCTCVRRAAGAWICSGPTGAVSRLWHGHQERVVEGLPSWSNAAGRAQGPNGVAMLGLGTAYVTIGLEAAPDSVDLLRAGLGTAFGQLVRVRLPTGDWSLVADLVEYEKQFDPEPRVIDSNPFGLLVGPNGVVVADSGGNDLLHVAANGEISTLAVLPPVPHGNHDSVPTSVAIGPDGAYYVGELTAAPFVAGAATIYRLVPGGSPQTYLTGFKTVIGIAFDQAGNLYVLQHATGATGLAGSGVLIRVAPDGTPTTVLAGLDRSTGVAVGPDGAAYVTNKGLLVGGGEVLRIEPIATVRDPDTYSLNPASRAVAGLTRNNRGTAASVHGEDSIEGGVNPASEEIASNEAVQAEWEGGGLTFEAAPIAEGAGGNGDGGKNKKLWKICVKAFDGSTCIDTALIAPGNGALRSARAITQAIAFLQQRTTRPGALVRLSFTPAGVLVRVQSRARSLR